MEAYRANHHRTRGHRGGVIANWMSMSLSMAGCAATPCPSGGPCGLASWISQPSPALGDARMVSMPAVAAVATIDGADLRAADEIVIGSSPVLLDFDLSPLRANETVDRAVLSLAPHPAWRTGGATGRVRVLAWSVTSAWTTASVGAQGPPALGTSPVGEVVLRAGIRVPIRIDVTAAVRAWHDGRHEGHGIALSCESGEIAVRGARTSDDSMRPRLEVAAR